MSTALASIARPRWVKIRRVPSEIDPTFDACSFECGRCDGARAFGPPQAVLRESADHVLLSHSDDREAGAWARDQLARLGIGAP